MPLDRCLQDCAIISEPRSGGWRDQASGGFEPCGPVFRDIPTKKCGAIHVGWRVQRVFVGIFNGANGRYGLRAKLGSLQIVWGCRAIANGGVNSFRGKIHQMPRGGNAKINFRICRHEISQSRCKPTRRD